MWGLLVFFVCAAALAVYGLRRRRRKRREAPFAEVPERFQRAVSSAPTGPGLPRPPDMATPPSPPLARDAAAIKAAMAQSNFDTAQAWGEPWNVAPLWTSRHTPEVFGVEYWHKGALRSDEEIILSEVRQSGPFHYLKGRCLRTLQSRTVQVDRITRAWNAITGEKITDPTTFFTRTLPEQGSTDEGYGQSIERARPSLRVLAWIARADRSISKAEMDVLIAFAEARKVAGRKPVHAHLDRRRAEVEIRGMRSDLAHCLATVSRMAPEGIDATLLREHVGRLVALGAEGTARRAAQVMAPLGGLNPE